MEIKLSNPILSEKDQETLKNLAEKLNGLPFELVVDEPRRYIDKPDTETMRKLANRYESLRPYLHLLPLLEKNKEGKLAFTEEGKQCLGYGYESNAESQKHMDLIWQNMCFEEVGENSKKNPADAAAKVRLTLEKFIRVLVSSKHALYLSKKHAGQRRGELYIYDYDQKRAYSLNSSEGWDFLQELYYSVGKDSSQRDTLANNAQDQAMKHLHVRAENLMPYPEVQPHEVKCADGIFNTITRTFTPYSYLYPQHLRIAASYHVDATEQERKKAALFLQQLLKDIASLDPLQLENMTDMELDKAREDRLNRLKNIFVLLTAVATGYTRQEAIFLAVGGAGTGKSTLSKLCTNMVGAENCSSVPISAMDDHNQLEAMIGKIANISSDEEEGYHQKNFMTLKSIVSSEPITLNRKYLKSIKVKFPNVIVQFANDVVRLGKGRASADRRIAFISLTNGAGNRGEGVLSKEDVQRYIEGNDPLVSSLLLGMVLGQETLRNKVDFTDFHIYREEKGEKQQIVRFVADYLAVKHDEEAMYPRLSNPDLQVLPVKLLHCIYKEWVKTEDSGIQMTLTSFTKEVEAELEHYGFKLQSGHSTIKALENKENAEGRGITRHFLDWIAELSEEFCKERGKFFRRAGSPVTPEQVRAAGNTTTSPAKDVSWSELFDHDSKVLQHVYAHPSLYADILEGRTLEVEKIEAAEIPKPQPVDPNQLPQMIAASATDPTQRDAVREALKLVRRKPVSEELEDAYMQETENLLMAHRVELEKPYRASNQRYRTQNINRTAEVLEKVWEAADENADEEADPQDYPAILAKYIEDVEDGPGNVRKQVVKEFRSTEWPGRDEDGADFFPGAIPRNFADIVKASVEHPEYREAIEALVRNFQPTASEASEALPVIETVRKLNEQYRVHIPEKHIEWDDKRTGAKKSAWVDPFTVSKPDNVKFVWRGLDMDLRMIWDVADVKVDTPLAKETFAFLARKQWKDLQALRELLGKWDDLYEVAPEQHKAEATIAAKLVRKNLCKPLQDEWARHLFLCRAMEVGGPLFTNSIDELYLDCRWSEFNTVHLVMMVEYLGEWQKERQEFLEEFRRDSAAGKWWNIPYLGIAWEVFLPDKGAKLLEGHQHAVGTQAA